MLELFFVLPAAAADARRRRARRTAVAAVTAAAASAAPPAVAAAARITRRSAFFAEIFRVDFVDAPLRPVVRALLFFDPREVAALFFAAVRRVPVLAAARFVAVLRAPPRVVRLFVPARALVVLLLEPVADLRAAGFRDAAVFFVVLRPLVLFAELRFAVDFRVVPRDVALFELALLRAGDFRADDFALLFRPEDFALLFFALLFRAEDAPPVFDPAAAFALLFFDPEDPRELLAELLREPAALFAAPLRAPAGRFEEDARPPPDDRPLRFTNFEKRLSPAS